MTEKNRKAIASSLRSRGGVYAFAVAATAATFLIHHALGFTAGDHPLPILFFIPIILSAYYGGWGPGLLATLLAAAGTSFYLLPPDHSFAIERIDDRVGWAVLLIGGVLTALLNESLRRSTRRIEPGERRYRELVELSPDAVFLRRGDKIIFVNAAAVKLFGAAKAADLIGKSPLELFHPDFHDQLRKRMKRLEQGQTVSLVEEKVVRLDGSVRDVEVAAAPFEDQAGQAVQVILRDITGRKLAEIKLRESEARFLTVFQASPVGIGITRISDGTFIDVNQTFLELFGYARAEVIQHTSSELGAWIDPEARRDLIEKVREHGRVQQLEAKFRRRSGEVFDLLISAERIELDCGPCLLAILTDISARKQVERERQNLEAQLRQVQKMEAIGHLSGGIAHDFNNILGVIIGNAELARQDVGRDHPAQEWIAEIFKSGERAKNLVQQILMFARQQKSERQVIALAGVVQESVKLLRSTLPARVELKDFCAPDAPHVLADSTQIHQIMLNLCTNAWHAMADRPGSIHVTLAGVEVTGELVRVHPELQPGPYARLSVADTGKGMEAAILERIFDPFFTTKEPGQGTGLGLSVVHGIMKTHCGAIVVKSQPGRGTTFDLYFPAAEENAALAVSPEKKISRGAGQRVLFLDDEQQLVKLAKRILERAGFQVAGFSSPVEALNAFHERPAEFDMVVTDFDMPGINGLQVAAEILKARPGMLLLLCSGYVTDELTERARQAGVRQVLYKPHSADQMCEVISRLLSEIPITREASPP